MEECLSEAPSEGTEGFILSTFIQLLYHSLPSKLMDILLTVMECHHFPDQGRCFFTFYLFSSKQFQDVKIPLVYEFFTYSSLVFQQLMHFARQPSYYFHLLIMWFVMSLAHLPYCTSQKENQNKILVFKSQDSVCTIATLSRNVHQEKLSEAFKVSERAGSARINYENFLFSLFFFYYAKNITTSLHSGQLHPSL